MGQAMRALENDPGVALMIGIPTERVRVVAFALGSALVALAAMLTALDKGIEPTIGVNALLVAVVAMIVGGVGSYVGAALAGFSLGHHREPRHLADPVRVAEHDHLHRARHLHPVPPHRHPRPAGRALQRMSSAESRNAERWAFKGRTATNLFREVRE